MTCDIFIKSHGKDFPWLRYCLKSIGIFCRGFNKIILLVDNDDRKELDDWNLTRETVHSLPSKSPGYLHQQWCKLHADQWCLSDYIMFVDSDCHFIRSVTPLTFFQDGRPLMLKTRFSSLGDTVPWRATVEASLGFPCEWETMRRFPMIYPRTALSALRDHLEAFHRKSVEDLIFSSVSFSEFNVLGSFVLARHPELFHWIDTESEALPELALIQHFSHGGISEEIKRGIERVLDSATPDTQ